MEYDLLMIVIIKYEDGGYNAFKQNLARWDRNIRNRNYKIEKEKEREKERERKREREKERVRDKRR